MNINGVFTHDHIFSKSKDGKVYSDGKLTRSSWQRYLAHCSRLTVIARGTLGKNVGELSISSCSNVYFELLPNYNKPYYRFIDTSWKERITKVIVSSDFLIARLPSTISLQALKIARLYRKPSLIELVGCPEEALRTHGSLRARIAMPIVRAEVKREVKEAQHVVYVTKGFLNNKYPTNGKSVSISNVDISVTQEALENRLHKIDSGQLLKRVGFVGSLDSKYKGLESAIGALGKLRLNHMPMDLMVVGGGDSKIWRRLAQTHGVAENITFLGSIKHADMFDFLDELDMYIHPSLTEGLPRALIEAMSRGLPCIGSRVGGVPELLPERWLVPPSNAEALSVKLREMMRCNPEELGDIARRNHKVAAEFDDHILSERRSRFFTDFLTQVSRV